jgi:hypothetical protein
MHSTELRTPLPKPLRCSGALCSITELQGLGNRIIRRPSPTPSTAPARAPGRLPQRGGLLLLWGPGVAHQQVAKAGSQLGGVRVSRISRWPRPGASLVGSGRSRGSGLSGVSMPAGYARTSRGLRQCRRVAAQAPSTRTTLPSWGSFHCSQWRSACRVDHHCGAGRA